MSRSGPDPNAVSRLQHQLHGRSHRIERIDRLDVEVAQQMAHHRLLFQQCESLTCNEHMRWTLGLLHNSIWLILISICKRQRNMEQRLLTERVQENDNQNETRNCSNLFSFAVLTDSTSRSSEKLHPRKTSRCLTTQKTLRHKKWRLLQPFPENHPPDPHTPEQTGKKKTN